MNAYPSISRKFRAGWRLGVLLLASSLAACGPPDRKKSKTAVSVVVEKRADGLSYRAGETKPYTGEIAEVNISGRQESLERWLDGKPHGLWQWRRADGSTKREETYTHGEKIRLRQWHENGNLKEDSQMRDGIVQGQVRLWWPNGRLRRSCFMEADLQLHGQVLQYGETGYVIFDAIYDHGKYVSGQIPDEHKLADNSTSQAE